ncbi:MAG: hypothetical protein AAFV77_01015 [Planctomycetota bacterium]
MPSPIGRLSIVILGIAVAAATPSAQAQTICGQWEPLFDDLVGDLSTRARTRVSDLVVFDAGDGPKLYMAGNFESVIDSRFGEVRAPGLARWDGERWSAVPGLDGPGLELNSRVITLEVLDDGTGPALYIGGEFTSAAGLEAPFIAKWDGTSWTTFEGPGSPSPGSKVTSIHVHDFGDGPSLFVCGDLFDVATLTAPAVLQWDGTAWIRPGSNLPGSTSGSALASFDGDLFVGGLEMGRDGERIPAIASFDGEDWSTPVGENQRIIAFPDSEFWELREAEINGQDVLLASGRFRIIEDDTQIASNLAYWDGERWVSAEPTTGFHANVVADFVDFDDGDGPGLFMAGSDIQSRWHAAVLRDGAVRPLFGLDGRTAYTIFAYDDGEESQLLVGGEFGAPFAAPPYLARWQPGEPCKLDWDGDCFASIGDYVAFYSALVGGDLAADFDDDGELTHFDLLAYINAYLDGCP